VIPDGELAFIFLSSIFLSFLDRSSEWLLIQTADIGVNVNGHRPLQS
jgi:hypothetical protein